MQSAAAPARLTIHGRDELSDGRGTTTVEWRSARVLFFRTRGFLSGELARFALAHNAHVLDQVRAEGATLHAFYDWGEMSGYASEARAASTQFLVQRRREFASIHILTGSSLVAMAVTVANLLVSGFMQATTDRKMFEDWLKNAG